MPSIDVSDVLTDLDFVDCFSVTRSTENLVNGINTPTQEVFSEVYGVVTPNDDLNLLRTPEGARLAGSITIHTQFQLSDGGADGDADIVTWNGRAYTVTSVGDWSRYGDGFVVAICAYNQVQP